MIRGDIKEEVRMTTGSRGMDANLNKWIDQARKTLVTKYDLPFSDYYKNSTATTTVGTQEYALPSDYLRHMILYLGDKRLTQLPHIYWAQVKELNVTSTETNEESTYYVIRGPNIFLHSPPDEEYTLKMYYYGLPDDLTGDSVTDGLLTNYPYTVIWNVVKSVAVHSRDAGLIQIASGEARNFESDMVQDLRKRKTGNQDLRVKTIEDFDVSDFRKRMGYFD